MVRLGVKISLWVVANTPEKKGGLSAALPRTVEE